MQAAAVAHGWCAKLDLVLERGHRGRTRLTLNRHRGPLCVQRPFYPESDGRAHVYLIHTPGGVVGGDLLEIDLVLREGARALFTTPAATKFYRSPDRSSSQKQRIRAGADTILEWLPQETILFEAARAELSTRIELAQGARFAGWEILCLGRTASGERFKSGSVTQRFEVWRDGVPLLVERLALGGGDPLLAANGGLAGQPVVGVFALTLGPDGPRASTLIASVRAALPELRSDDRFSITSLRELLVCRYLGPRANSARRCFERAWSVLRPALLDAEAQAPRVWAT